MSKIFINVVTPNFRAWVSSVIACHVSKFDKNIFKLEEMHLEDLTCYRSLQARLKFGPVLMFKLESLRHESIDYLQQIHVRLARITGSDAGIHKPRNVLKT